MQYLIYRFDKFELNSAEGKLRSGNTTVLMQEKPLFLLNALLDNPQRLVTREQLRERMWDSRTVVNYEQSINVAVKKVRDALGDSAENPKFIETVAKRGYRFLVPVSVVAAEFDVQALGQAPPPAADPAMQPLANAKKPVRYKPFHLAIAAGVVCVLGIGLYASQSKPRHPAQFRSLAVLPLQDLSPASTQEYFADGITEEVITDLAQSLPLRVISRTSVMRYKRTDKPIAEIAKDLGVDLIVEGAVARSGDRVRVTVQLIDAAEDRHLWARTYDRRLEDVLAIESEVSQAVASQVGGTLGLQSAKLISSRAVDPQVHELCLMGRYHWNKRTVADLAKAQAYYEQAIARAPGYAPAYAGLANVYALLPSYGTAALPASLAKAAAAAQHALELDENLADAHATLGLIAVNTPDWERSEPEFRRAIELDPNNATSHHWLAYYLFFAGRQDEALAQIALARELDPLSAVTNADEGHFLYATRHFSEARARLREAMELEPELGQSHATLALIELESGHPAEAVKEAHAALSLDPTSVSTIGQAGYVLASVGQIKEANDLLARLKDQEKHGSTAYVYFAMLEVGLGQRDQALQSLTEMMDLNIGAGLEGLSQFHAFDELRADARIQKLAAKARND
jgi:TolB-like protein/DNA-binding winged helix-turn-helix (wHTH) protein/tetratricopeptide (TPR) repeat protein